MTTLEEVDHCGYLHKAAIFLSLCETLPCKTVIFQMLTGSFPFMLLSSLGLKVIVSMFSSVTFPAFKCVTFVVVLLFMCFCHFVFPGLG